MSSIDHTACVKLIVCWLLSFAVKRRVEYYTVIEVQNFTYKFSTHKSIFPYIPLELGLVIPDILIKHTLILKKCVNKITFRQER